MRKIIDIYPEAPNTWVYRDHPDDPMPDGTPRRQFEPSVSVRIEDESFWHECTDQQRRDWEEQHPEQEQEPSPEPSDVPANVPADPASPADEKGEESAES